MCLSVFSAFTSMVVLKFLNDNDNDFFFPSEEDLKKNVFGVIVSRPKLFTLRPVQHINYSWLFFNDIINNISSVL